LTEASNSMIMFTLESLAMDATRDVLRLLLRYSITAAGQMITIASLFDLSTFAGPTCDILLLTTSLSANLGKKLCADWIESLRDVVYTSTPDQSLDMFAIRSSLEIVVR